MDQYSLWMTAIFIIGYLLIIFEHYTHINKSAVAIMMAILCWILQIVNKGCPVETSMSCLGVHIADVSQIVFFLLGALSIVEFINLHQGFQVVLGYVKATSTRVLLWVIGFITFFLSSILDNLTTTIVMVSLLQKLLPKSNDRWIIGGGVVIAANAGGAWTPIGDVTTTMLWIGGKLTAGVMMKDLFLPSLVCMITSFIPLSFMLQNTLLVSTGYEAHPAKPYGTFFFYLGILLLVFVPLFKLLTGLPPFMGMLFGFSILWILSDYFYGNQRKDDLKMTKALSRIDLPSTLFFLGILLCMSALETAHVLKHFSQLLDNTIGNTTAIATIIGLASAVVDNVPLVAAAMGMYDLTHHPANSQFWDMVAYTAGTGGSILIIGSAAGVVYMGLEHVDFFWYMRKITIPAAIGFFAGIATYLLLV